MLARTKSFNSSACGEFALLFIRATVVALVVVVAVVVVFTVTITVGAATSSPMHCWVSSLVWEVRQHVPIMFWT